MVSLRQARIGARERLDGPPALLPSSGRRRRFNVDFQLRADYGLDHRASGAEEMRSGG